MSDTSTDAVITWVDGTDPKHQASLTSTLKALGRPAPSSVTGSRLRDVGELEYCVVSILRFAPWIRHIYIATDNQIPPLIARMQNTRYKDRVSVVSHQTLFKGFEQYLPTFNTRTISAMLHRIPGLSRQFLYFNDDYFLAHPVDESAFFQKGKVVLRGQWKTLRRYSATGNILKSRIRQWLGKPIRASYQEAQKTAARLLGVRKQFLALDHSPHPRITSHIEDYFVANPEVLAAQLRDQFRSPEQFVSESLSAHLEIQKNNAVIDNDLKTIHLKPADQSLLKIKCLIESIQSNPKHTFLCVQGLADADEQAFQRVNSFIQHHIGSLDSLLEE